MLEFIDVSHHQGQIDWKKAASVIDGAVIRCGLRGYGSAGKLQADSCWERNIRTLIPMQSAVKVVSLCMT